MISSDYCGFLCYYIQCALKYVCRHLAVLFFFFKHVHIWSKSHYTQPGLSSYPWWTRPAMLCFILDRAISVPTLVVVLVCQSVFVNSQFTSNGANCSKFLLATSRGFSGLTCGVRGGLHVSRRWVHPLLFSARDLTRHNHDSYTSHVDLMFLVAAPRAVVRAY